MPITYRLDIKVVISISLGDPEGLNIQPIAEQAMTDETEKYRQGVLLPKIAQEIQEATGASATVVDNGIEVFNADQRTEDAIHEILKRQGIQRD